MWLALGLGWLITVMTITKLFRSKEATAMHEMQWVLVKLSLCTLISMVVLFQTIDINKP